MRKIWVCFQIADLSFFCNKPNQLCCFFFNHIFFFRTTLLSFPSIQRSSMEDPGLWWSSRMWWMCQRETPRTKLATLLKPWSSAISSHLLTSQSGLQCRTVLSPLIGCESGNGELLWKALIAMDEASEAFDSRGFWRLTGGSPSSIFQIHSFSLSFLLFAMLFVFLLKLCWFSLSLVAQEPQLL